MSQDATIVIHEDAETIYPLTDRKPFNIKGIPAADMSEIMLAVTVANNLESQSVSEREVKIQPK